MHIGFNSMIMYIFMYIYLYIRMYIYILILMYYYRNLPVDCLHAVGLASNVRSRKEQNGNGPAKNMTQESPKSTYPLVGSLGVQVHRKHAH